VRSLFSLSVALLRMLIRPNRYKLIRGQRDLGPVAGRTRSRSKYGSTSCLHSSIRIFTI
jgi:hypothetical protein